MEQTADKSLMLTRGMGGLWPPERYVMSDNIFCYLPPVNSGRWATVRATLSLCGHELLIADVIPHDHEQPETGCLMLAVQAPICADTSPQTTQGAWMLAILKACKERMEQGCNAPPDGS